MVLFTVIVGINGSVHSYLVMNCYVHNHYKVKLNLLQILHCLMVPMTSIMVINGSVDNRNIKWVFSHSY